MGFADLKNDFVFRRIFVLTGEHAKKFMDGQQQQVTKQKLEEAAGEAHEEMLSRRRSSSG